MHSNGAWTAKMAQNAHVLGRAMITSTKHVWFDVVWIWMILEASRALRRAADQMNVNRSKTANRAAPHAKPRAQPCIP